MLGPGFPGSFIHSQVIYRPPGHVPEKMSHEREVSRYPLVGEIEYHLDWEIFHMEAGDVVHHHTS
jgi:hypothetical protein